ncbi:MAG: 50S ribosomal protein L1 [Candidatus Electrothrix sp. AX5]|jgi:large subunit ribosomal protein L1|uniref:Large ribosomal subunit protein uL1 n=1 Tax=Candidatus Electrothrix aarhusensis TaxID=1859131 RepID=A0A3S4T6H6_9BACT|nr:50S ribosomal protein L1 [Candidatus Electrothrix sp. AX5]RWX44066.1 LSU ribosomal protein L1P [Candidatus Electrothrix aarhusensis]
MPKHGKQYRKAAEGIERGVLYSLEDAVNLLLANNCAKFDESIDVAVRLGIDPRHADQMVRASVILPNGTGKDVRVLVFAKGEKEAEALAAGADYAGSEELVKKIKEGWLEFDKTIATPDMMGEVGKIGRVLGPRNLMPNAKLGSVTFDIERVVQETKKGKVDFKSDKAGIIHALIGKRSFGPEKLVANIAHFVDKLIQLKPSTSKGVYLRSISLSSTMGPSVKIDTMQIRALIKA